MSQALMQLISAAPLLLVQTRQVLWPFFQLGNFIENIFLQIPYWGVKAIVIMFFLGLASAPFFLPKEYIFKGAEDQKPWRDLRYWALAAAISEIVVYLYF
jgi:hypothetical protein